MFKGLVKLQPKSVPATESFTDTQNENASVESAIFKSIDLTDLNEETASLEAYTQTLEKRYATQDAFMASVEKFGADAGLIDYALKTNVFTTTSLDTAGATEALISSDPEAALESVLTAALEEEKAEAGEVATKGAGVIQTAIEKVKEISEKIVAKLKAGASKVKETVKAHPYASAAAAVAVIAAAATAITLCSRKVTTVSNIKGPEDMRSWMDAVKEPVRNFKAGLGEKVNSTRQTYTNGTKASLAGEWTAKKIDAIAGGLSAATSKLVSALQSLGSAVKRVATGAAAAATPKGGSKGALVVASQAGAAAKGGGLRRVAVLGSISAAVVSVIVGGAIVAYRKLAKTSEDLAGEAPAEPAAA